MICLPGNIYVCDFWQACMRFFWNLWWYSCHIFILWLMPCLYFMICTKTDLFAAMFIIHLPWFHILILWFVCFLYHEFLAMFSYYEFMICVCHVMIGLPWFHIMMGLTCYDLAPRLYNAITRIQIQICMYIWIWVCVCVCVCCRERKREESVCECVRMFQRERERWRESERLRVCDSAYKHMRSCIINEYRHKGIKTKRACVAACMCALHNVSWMNANILINMYTYIYTYKWIQIYEY